MADENEDHVEWHKKLNEDHVELQTKLNDGHVK